MTIILFLVDTSASMNQRTYLGTALIDVARAAVESFMKVNKQQRNKTKHDRPGEQFQNVFIFVVTTVGDCCFCSFQFFFL